MVDLGALNPKFEPIVARIYANLPDLAVAIEAFVARLTAAEVGIGALGLGETFPDAMLPDVDGRLRRLAEVTAGRPSVIAFLRGHWCPFCRTYFAALAQARDLPARQTGADMGAFVAITPELSSFARNLSQSPNDIVLSDIGNGFAASLGLAVAIDENLARLLSEDGDDVPLYQGEASWIVPIPATFVLDGEMRVLERHVDPDYRKRMDLSRLSRLIEAASYPAGAAARRDAAD